MVQSRSCTSTSGDLSAVELVFAGRTAGHIVDCDFCEALHHVGACPDGGGTFASQCHDGPGSPFASSYRLRITGQVRTSDDAKSAAPFAQREEFWRECERHARCLRAHIAALVLGRSDADVIVTEPVEGLDFRLAGHRWHHGKTSGPDLLTLARHLYGIRAGVVAVRLLEAGTGVRFDAVAVLAIVDAIEAFYGRGAPFGEGRRA